MDMNNLEKFAALDPEKMIDHINGLPDQLQAAWQFGQTLDLPVIPVKRVLVAGMGGSAIGADLLAAYAAPLCSASINVLRDYTLPLWADDEETLVICSSHSGNTEETLSVFTQAVETKCQVMAISTGGKLAEAAEQHDVPIWKFDYPSQPRAAVGYSFGLLLAVFARLNLIPDPSSDLTEAVAAMKAQQESLRPEVPDTGNSAKRMAGQFMGRWITIWGSGIMAPVARRWKAQINENAKAQSAYEELPEADHNALQGILQPEGQHGATMNIWLRAHANHPRHLLRDEFTRMAFMLEGQNTDFNLARGEGRLAQIWTALHYGDYVSYYLAMAYELDPTPVPMLADLKGKMSAAG